MSKKIVLLCVQIVSLWAEQVVLVPYTHHLGQIKILFFLDPKNKEIIAMHDIVTSKDDPIERAARIFSQQTKGAFGKFSKENEQGASREGATRDDYYESIEKIREAIEKSVHMNLSLKREAVQIYCFEVPYLDARTIEKLPLLNAISLGKEYRHHQLVWIPASLVFKKAAGTLQVRPFRTRGAGSDARTKGWLATFARHRSFELQELIEPRQRPIQLKKSRKITLPRRRAVRTPKR
jgi:hypothetical protein